MIKKPALYWSKLAVVALGSCILFGSAIASAQGGPGQSGTSGSSSEERQPRGHRHGPPPEMIAACANKTAGATCSAVGREGQALTGTCFAPEGKPLACRPAGAPPGPPPPEGKRRPGEDKASRPPPPRNN